MLDQTARQKNEKNQMQYFMDLTLVVDNQGIIFIAKQCLRSLC